MKRSTFLLIPALFFCLSVKAQRECGPPKYMRQAMANVVAKGILLNDLSDMGFHKDVCMMGTYLSAGETVGFTTQLSSGVAYAFVGGGDDDVTDLDIFLYDAQGKELTKDTKTDNSPLVTYTPATTGSYTVKVKMFSTKTPGSFASLLIMSDAGYTIPIKTLKAALSDLFSMMEALCQKINKMGFLSTNNQWAMFGCVLDEGKSTQISNIRLSSSKLSAIIGGGDQNAFDVDLFLYSKGGTLLKKDDATDAHPVVTYKGSAGSEYTLKMKNARSGGEKSLIMSAILEVE
ncbi:MAG: hypothetical protein KF734_11325 [Saprospiraceae bacterium]|nr:hypothetical protein [Saprospiraceae bacterium]